MSTAVAYPPGHSSTRTPSNLDAHRIHLSPSPRNYQNIAPARPSSTGSQNQSAMSSSPPRPSSNLAPRTSAEGSRPGSHTTPLISHSQPARVSPQTSKLPAHPSKPDDTLESPLQTVLPSVEVKTERPSTPELAQAGTAPASRHRPRKLDLSTSVNVPPGRASGTLTAKDSAPLTALQDIGIACLSPGFQTEDPRMTQQLQRSMDLREQQRQIIESRLHKNNKDGEASGSKGNSDHGNPHAPIFPKPPGTSKRKGPPPGLSIHAPAATEFASEPRVIQSAPLNQSFTGLHSKGPPNVHPLSRQVLETSHQHRRPSNQHAPPSATSSSQQFAPHVSTPQTANRLPPIQDVFANDKIGSSMYRPTHTLSRANSGPGGASGQMYAPLTASANSASARSPKSAQYNGAMPSPGFPLAPQSAGLHPPSQTKDYKSAEEAVQAMAGGRDELLPKIVHYGGHQPPTPPSPLPPGQQGHPGERKYSGPGSLRAEIHSDVSRSMSGRRRTRDEYERDGEDRRAADEDRMDIDGDRGRSYRTAPSRSNGEAATESGAAGGAGFGFGFGSWSGDDRKKRSPEEMRRKKEEFIALCARAWDLLHE